MRSPAISAAKSSDELQLLRDVQVDSDQQQRPENDREHGGPDQPERVQVLEVVVRSGDRDAHHEVDDAEETWSEHAREGYPDERRRNKKGWRRAQLERKLTSCVSRRISGSSR